MPEQELQGERVLQRDRRRLHGQQQLFPAILRLGDLWGEKPGTMEGAGTAGTAFHALAAAVWERCQPQRPCDVPHRDRTCFNNPNASIPPTSPLPSVAGEALTLQDAKDVAVHRHGHHGGGQVLQVAAQRLAQGVHVEGLQVAQAPICQGRDLPWVVGADPGRPGSSPGAASASHPSRTAAGVQHAAGARAAGSAR